MCLKAIELTFLHEHMNALNIWMNLVLIEVCVGRLNFIPCRKGPIGTFFGRDLLVFEVQ